MPQALIPILTTVGGSLASSLIGKAFAPKEKKTSAENVAQQPAAKLFNPQQISKATDQYKSEAGAKWNQILSNMGAGGGTGAGDVTSTIGSQADQLAAALGGLTTESGYGSSPDANMGSIMAGVEKGINPKYALY